MPTVTNAGAEPIKWTLRRASSEFGVSIPTLVGKLNEVGETADENKTFSTRSIVAALYGDTYKERLAKLKAEREHTELETSILKGDYVNRRGLESSMGEIANAMRQVVRSSALSRVEQDDFLRSLASIKIVIKDAASRQARQPALGRNGANRDKSQPARRSKRKPADSADESEPASQRVGGK